MLLRDRDGLAQIMIMYVAFPISDSYKLARSKDGV